MAVDPTNHGHEGAQADLPEPDSAAAHDGPGAADDGADAVQSLVGDRDAVATEQPPEPAEAYAVAGEELAALTARAEKADEYLSLAQRTQADFDNYRKRAIREAAAAQERGAVKLATALLPAVDNLERALAHAPQDADAPSGAQAIDGFVSGIKHVHADVVTALQKAGIEPYSPEGEPFDPTQHEAVAQQPTEGAEAGTVVEVFQRGYRIGETVVRPARVVVAG